LTKLVPPSLQAAQAEEKEAGELSPPPVTADENISMAKRKEAEDAWVKKTSKGGNMSLMTVDKRYAGRPSEPFRR